jgi:hypothetical protein
VGSLAESGPASRETPLSVAAFVASTIGRGIGEIAASRRVQDDSGHSFPKYSNKTLISIEKK